MTADQVAEVKGHHAVCEELRKHMHGDRRPLSKVSPVCVLYSKMNGLYVFHCMLLLLCVILSSVALPLLPVQTVCDHVLATGLFLKALYKRLEERILRKHKKDPGP